MAQGYRMPPGLSPLQLYRFVAGITVAARPDPAAPTVQALAQGARAAEIVVCELSSPNVG